MTTLLISAFSINSDKVSGDNLLMMLAEAFQPDAHISMDTADGSKSTFWKACAMEIDYDKNEAIILVETVWGKRLLRISKNDSYHASLEDSVGTRTNLLDFENSHLCFHGKHIVQIDF